MATTTTIVSVTGNWSIPANSKPQVTVTVSISAPSPLDGYLTKGLYNYLNNNFPGFSIQLLNNGQVIQTFTATMSQGTDSISFSGTGQTVSSATTFNEIKVVSASTT